MNNVTRRSQSVESNTHGSNHTHRGGPPKVWRRAVAAGMTYASWKALGDWAATLLPWAYDGTLTFNHPVSDSRALDHAKTWLSGLARQIDGHIPVLFGVERHEIKGHHVHLLLRPEPRIGIVDVATLERTWFASTPAAGPQSVFRVFLPGAGGEHYTVKDGDWGFFVVCPKWRTCRRAGRGGCHRERALTRVIAQR